LNTARSVRKLWPHSLFTRLLLAQGMVLVGAVLIFGILGTIERNLLLARQYAAIWEPVVRQVMAAPVGAPALPAYEVPGGIRHEPGAPFWRFPTFPATLRAAREVVEPRGLQVDGIWLTVGSRGSTIWMALRLNGGAQTWVSLNDYRWMPGWSPRMALGLVLTLALMAVASGYFVSHVTRPLAALHARMLHHARTGEVLVMAPSSPAFTAPPELQAMDQAYSQLADKLERNERERALLLAGVSHDLRSPLARIRLAAEMLPETPDNAEGVAAVTRNVDVADRLIASFLEFVRASTQKLDESFDAAALVREAVADFGRPQQELRAQLPERLLLHGANGLLLERLVVNLVENALKHGDTPVLVHLACIGETMELTVVDSGSGLPAGGAESLIEAFARGDASRGVAGFGLGLAIVQQIVTRLQGRLSFERSPSGHAVKVILPLVR
jgi:two-component system osmolarity sensor histidine kinase EnvZ